MSVSNEVFKEIFLADKILMLDFCLKNLEAAVLRCVTRTPLGMGGGPPRRPVRGLEARPRHHRSSPAHQCARQVPQMYPKVIS